MTSPKMHLKIQLNISIQRSGWVPYLVFTVYRKKNTRQSVDRVQIDCEAIIET